MHIGLVGGLMNAISLLQKDHRAVEAIFDQLEELKGDGKPRKKEELCERLVRELPTLRLAPLL